ncbi:MAG TPA: hypothetical protein VE131_04480 [Terriglobales bacterium]|nr:hypothetical protein [Terriglobales bacterium]
MASERVMRRLTLLEGLDLSQADIESIIPELEDYDRTLRELEVFAEGTSWPSLPVQPYFKKD